MLYYLNADSKEDLRRVQQVRLHDAGWKEQDLENLLAAHIERLVRTDQLFVIAQQRPRQEEADIMALDQEGTLYLFELKRWEGREENLLQVLRYGQRFGQYEYDRLNNYFHSYQLRSGSDGPRASLQEAHRKYFDLQEALPKEQFNRKQRFVIVTNGLDLATWQAIQYWKGYGFPVDALLYRVYTTDNKQVLLDFDPYGPQPMLPDVAGEGLWVVNTNLTYSAHAYRDMLEQNKAAAYGNRKYGITNIRKGAQVCLYHTGVGVIAIGKATGDYQRRPDGDDPDGEYFVPCKFEYKVDPDVNSGQAVPAWEINQHFGTGHRFRQTVFSLERKYADFIRARFKKKRNEQREAVLPQ